MSEENPTVADWIDLVELGPEIGVTTFVEIIVVRKFVGTTPLTQQFIEKAYRQQNPDVDQAIRNGLFVSGKQHFEAFGKAEGRSPGGCPQVDTCNTVIDFRIQRDLFDPSTIATVSDVAAKKGLRRAQFRPFFRNFLTGDLEEVDYDTPVETKASVVFVDEEIQTENELLRLAQRLQTSRNILPSRFVWP